MESIIKLTHFLPFFSTAISIALATVILGRYRSKPDSYHLLWWGIGILTYAAGTFVESMHTLFGWNVVIFKSWYIVGALLGGAPLAVGTVYLLLGRKAGHAAVALLTAAVVVTSVFVVLSPIKYDLVTSNNLTSKVLEWQKIRMVSPFINGFAVLFLVGGALYTVFKFVGVAESRHVAIGNLYIAVGALLPGIGGYYSRIGYTEALYVGELIGVILIWLGYKYCQRRSFAESNAASVGLYSTPD